MIITDAPSPNFGPRAQGKVPRLLILHYTDTKSGFEALKILQDPAREVSSHYLVDEDGSILRLVPEEMRAWHAGKSLWEGEGDLNSSSIGIEIQNPGHGHGYRSFPEVQMKSVAELCRHILGRHKILPNHVLAHSDIAPARKIDPGELFPWAGLALQGIGLWPQPTETERLDAEEEQNPEDALIDLLIRYGYDGGCERKTLITAFQRHFEPEAFEDSGKIGVITPRTLYRAKALMRQKLALRLRTV